MTSPYRVLQVAHKLLTPETFCNYQDEDDDNWGTARSDDDQHTSPRNATAKKFTLAGAIARAACECSDGDYLVGHGYNVYIAALKLVQPPDMNDLEFYLYCDRIGYKGCSELIERHI